MDGMICSGQIVDALMSRGRKRKCRELSVWASWFSAGNPVGKLVSLVPAYEVCAHTSARAILRLHYLVPSAGDRVGCSPQRWWDLEQKFTTF